MGHLLGGVTGVGQFGPDQVPVLRAQIAPTNSSGGGAFYGKAVLDRDWADTAAPLVHDGWRHINRLGKACLRTKPLAGQMNGFLVGHAQTLAVLKQ